MLGHSYYLITNEAIDIPYWFLVIYLDSPKHKPGSMMNAVIILKDSISQAFVSLIDWIKLA